MGRAPTAVRTDLFKYNVNPYVLRHEVCSLRIQFVQGYTTRYVK